MALTSRIVSLEDLDPGGLAAWADLAARAAEPNVFFEPEVLLPAARHLAPPGAVRLAVVEDGRGRWMACAPVRRVAAWRRLRLPCLTIWTHEYSGLEVPLVDAGAIRPAMAALLEGVRGPLGGLFVTFTQLPADGPVRAALRDVADGDDIEVARYERAVLRRRPRFSYLDGMKGKRRGELARQRRRLEERHAGVATMDVAADPAAVEWFLELEASGWKGREGTALASDPRVAAFFREACERLRGAGRLELLALMADGRPIAMKCNMLGHGRMFGFKQAFDESMAAYGPGKLLDIDTMRSFHEREDVDMLDTIASAENASINAMWPDRRALATVLVPTRGPLGRVAGWAVARVAGRRAAGQDAAPTDAVAAAGVEPQELVPSGR
ncbi:GNAT family N-acetyltransferase [Miltoncostaea marina]|uniref:GNAT family N-acetyltransferase n=1 Tax=Miltoncostaea marina TaxID=2843215 RepID=UPI001C3CA009|nr:GNAT family N-acetyltransferase [Miltoncostaea marina]